MLDFSWKDFLFSYGTRDVAGLEPATGVLHGLEELLFAWVRIFFFFGKHPQAGARDDHVCHQPTPCLLCQHDEQHKREYQHELSTNPPGRGDLTPALNTQNAGRRSGVLLTKSSRWATPLRVSTPSAVSWRRCGSLRVVL
jgi:hypothetical protein